MKNKKLRLFPYKGTEQKIDFIETIEVKARVSCDTYKFVNDETKDLAIIFIAKGAHTPLQKVLSGDKTIEGYISGSGTLTITNPEQKTKTYSFKDDSRSNQEFTVAVGSIMQWQADKTSALVIYEICHPPYQDGRYENIAE